MKTTFVYVLIVACSYFMSQVVSQSIVQLQISQVVLSFQPLIPQAICGTH